MGHLRNKVRNRKQDREISALKSELHELWEEKCFPINGAARKSVYAGKNKVLFS